MLKSNMYILRVSIYAQIWADVPNTRHIQLVRDTSRF